MTVSVKISALTTATVPNPNADVIPVVQGGVTKKMPIGQLGGLLGYAKSSVSSDYSTSSTTLVNVDATNLKVTFTAPSSGKVLVEFDIHGYCNTGAVQVGVRDASLNSIVANTLTTAFGGSNLAQSAIVSIPVISGLTPGTVYIYNMAFASGDGTSATIFATTSGGGLGPVMYVYAVPG